MTPKNEYQAMYLPEVEKAGPRPGPGVPQIHHLFAFKPEATRHLERFSEAVMRAPSPLNAGWRELIAAFTSKLNRCHF